MSETDPAFVQRYAALGAGLPPEIGDLPAPAAPTQTIEIDGVMLAPAARLLALAKIRDAHRAAGRATNDEMHRCREAVEDRQARIKRIRQSDGGRGSATGVAEIAQLEAEIGQFAAARAAAETEAEVAAAATRDAEALLWSALSFARDNGMIVPAVLQAEKI